MALCRSSEGKCLLMLYILSHTKSDLPESEMSHPKNTMELVPASAPTAWNFLHTSGLRLRPTGRSSTQPPFRPAASFGDIETRAIRRQRGGRQPRRHLTWTVPDRIGVDPWAEVGFDRGRRIWRRGRGGLISAWHADGMSWVSPGGWRSGKRIDGWR